MPSAQVVYNDSLTLPLFSAPWAEWEAYLSFHSLGGVYALETHSFGDSRGTTVLKKCPEKFPATPRPNI